MHIRIYSPISPFKSDGGTAIATLRQIRALLELGHLVEGVSWIATKDEDFWKNQWLGTIPHSIQKNLSWRNFRLRPLDESFLSRFSRISSSLFQKSSSPEQYYYPKNAYSKLSSQLKLADLGIFTYSFAANWILDSAFVPKESKTVVHFHNLESELFFLRGESSKNILSSRFFKFTAQKLRAHEKGLSQNKKINSLWFLSQRDLSLFHSRLSQSVNKCRLVPPPFFENPRIKKEPCSNAKKIGFIGNLDFEPNRKSVDWILRELLPEIRKEKLSVQVVIAGSGSPEALFGEEFLNAPEIVWLGSLQESQVFWDQISILLSPQKGGSGIRIKILEALEQGIPVLTNSGEGFQIGQSQDFPLLIVRKSAPEWVGVIRDQLSKPMDFTKDIKTLKEDLSPKSIYHFLEEGEL